MRRFVGLANYYRKFVLRFTALAAPHTALCNSRARFNWGAAEQRSFDALKAALTSAPVLRVWDPARPTRLLTDASELAVSTILEQPDDAGVFHPIAFESSKLTLPERSYPPHLLELLAVVHALKTLRPYLLDKPFDLHTDNASLQWLQQQRHVSHHQARWLNLLAEYQYRVTHIPGRTNPADFLTRKRFPDGAGPALRTGYNEPDSELELFTVGAPPAAAFVHAGSEPDAPRFLHADFAAALRAALPTDPELGPLAAAALAMPLAPLAPVGEPASAPRHSFVLRDGLLYRQSPRGDRLCIPAAGELRRTVLQELHATPLGGHFGRDKTLSLARRSVWWPGMPAAITEYVRTCATCQRVKADHLPPAGLLFPLPVPSRRGGCISLDFLELPMARSGHDFVQVHIDLLTGRVWLVPTSKTAAAETAARNFVGSEFRDVGLPDALVSDRDAGVSPASSGLRFTQRWAPRSSLARRTTTTPPARWSASTASSRMSCAPSLATVVKTGRSSCRWWSSPSTTPRPRWDQATLRSTPTAVSIRADLSPRPTHPTLQPPLAPARPPLT